MSCIVRDGFTTCLWCDLKSHSGVENDFLCAHGDGCSRGRFLSEPRKNSFCSLTFHLPFLFQAWDDVVRKEKPKEEAYEYKKRLTLDHEKSKLSLAEIYEQEYLKLNQVRKPVPSTWVRNNGVIMVPPNWGQGCWYHLWIHQISRSGSFLVFFYLDPLFFPSNWDAIHVTQLTILKWTIQGHLVHAVLSKHSV